MTMFESTKKTAQTKFMGVLDALNYSERASPNVQSVYTYLPSKKKKYRTTTLRNFTKHASKEKVTWNVGFLTLSYLLSNIVIVFY